MTDQWHPLISESDFPADAKFAAKVAGWHVFIARTDAGYHAFNDRCTHQAARLSPGRIRRGEIMCPLHGARFDLVTGKCSGNTYRGLRTFPLRIENGVIEVAIPAELPGMEELPSLT